MAIVDAIGNSAIVGTSFEFYAAGGARKTVPANALPLHASPLTIAVVDASLGLGGFLILLGEDEDITLGGVLGTVVSGEFCSASALAGE